ncbi:hypothetical protein TIFTF001_009017 [Ficus carica]|uniref:Protein FAM32A-like n=1 Tax=Ficus carica TaxID=3494 RepID=A0AA87ZP47_FICCA|nr:hypothetical protein TIFTF001_009017 [Ficus carica]
MSGYENVVGGRLKLKGKALDVKDGGINKNNNKKKKTKPNIKLYNYGHFSHSKEAALSKGFCVHLEALDGDTTDELEDQNDAEKDSGERSAAHDDYLTPAERRYLQQWVKLDRQRLAKMASKSHRDRIQEFNQYLANLSEHYDIPKVGPG